MGQELPVNDSQYTHHAVSAQMATVEAVLECVPFCEPNSSQRKDMVCGRLLILCHVSQRYAQASPRDHAHHTETSDFMCTSHVLSPHFTMQEVQGPLCECLPWELRFEQVNAYYYFSLFLLLATTPTYQIFLCDSDKAHKAYNILKIFS